MAHHQRLSVGRLRQHIGGTHVTVGAGPVIDDHGLAVAELDGHMGWLWPSAAPSVPQFLAAAAALEGIARQPEAAGKIQTVMIIALALIESLVIYALIISLLLVLKVG